MRPVRLLPLFCALAGCAHAPPLAVAPIPAAAQPRFDGIAFFTGRSVGEGRLSKVFLGVEPTHVENTGTLGDDGVLHLVQRVREGTKPVRAREWTVRKDRPGHYTGFLTDGPGLAGGTAYRFEARGRHWKTPDRAAPWASDGADWHFANFVLHAPRRRRTDRRTSAFDLSPLALAGPGVNQTATSFRLTTRRTA